MEAFRIPIHVEELHGIRREAIPVRVGVPLPRGALRDPDSAGLVDGDDRQLATQARVLARWPDRSIKWLLLDFSVSVQAHARLTIVLTNSAQGAAGNGLRFTESEDGCRIETGAASFFVPARGESLLGPIVDSQGKTTDRAALTAVSGGRTYAARVERLEIEDAGPTRATIVAEGRFHAAADVLPLEFRARCSFFAGARIARVELAVRNPRAALHPGNLWDLGDPGSCVIDDLTFSIVTSDRASHVLWNTEPANSLESHADSPLTIYQDSSGGEKWDSSNHVAADGSLTVTFRGFQVRSSPEQKVIASGNRAQPCFSVVTDAGRIAVSLEDFWQNFPKALRWREKELAVGLFPGECRLPFELQGGEQKRNALWVGIGAADDVDPVAPFARPVRVWIEPAAVEAAAAVPYLSSAVPEPDHGYRDYIDSIVEGERSFAARREIVDEYGWRNFGDLYADHEAVRHQGPKPFISHYNNQYDFLFGAGVHFLRSGLWRWRELLEAGARHTIDIDIYHTTEDRAAYNGGLFWHTEHHKDAATATHRTFSRRNGSGAKFGGGPSDEHNYTSGLLLYHYMTGDPEARRAVLELADWVVGMDDGARTLFALVDSRPTGNASRTVSDEYHKPGRGGGNSINALLDAYVVSQNRDYMRKAEELLCRCVHPSDDIAALRLDDPEIRWSYLVFLQVLGKYLDLKAEMGETDYTFYYARDSLRHYADWMMANEVPYKDVLHKVELPTETWPAQDVRKCHVLHLAAKCSTGERREAFARRAQFHFERCLQDLLGFDTAYFTRPRVLLAVYGHVHGYFQTHGYGSSESPHAREHGYSFGTPRPFLSQRAYLKQALRDKLRNAGTELGRLVRARVAAMKGRK